MAPNEKNASPGQNQAQAVPAEPGVMQQESPRKCKICGGPNHQGCGCEAKQLREAQEAGLSENEAKALTAETVGAPTDQPVQEPESQPNQKPIDDEEITRVLKQLTGRNIEDFQKIERVFENLENININLYDIVNLLKLISQEAMAIRATQQKIEAKMNNAKDTNHN